MKVASYQLFIHMDCCVIKMGNFMKIYNLLYKKNEWSKHRWWSFWDTLYKQTKIKNQSFFLRYFAENAGGRCARWIKRGRRRWGSTRARPRSYLQKTRSTTPRNIQFRACGVVWYGRENATNGHVFRCLRTSSANIGTCPWMSAYLPMLDVCCICCQIPNRFITLRTHF